MNEPDLVAALAALRTTEVPSSDALLALAFPPGARRRPRRAPNIPAVAAALLAAMATAPLALESNEGVREWNESIASRGRDVGRGFLELGGGWR